MIDNQREKFEKDFPSLKNKIFRKGGGFVDENEMMDPPKQVDMNYVVEHCVDKQRLREILVNKFCACSELYNMECGCLIKEILQELRL